MRVSERRGERPLSRKVEGSNRRSSQLRVVGYRRQKIRVASLVVILLPSSSNTNSKKEKQNSSRSLSSKALSGTAPQKQKGRNAPPKAVGFCALLVLASVDHVDERVAAVDVRYRVRCALAGAGGRGESKQEEARSGLTGEHIRLSFRSSVRSPRMLSVRSSSK